MCNLGSVNLGRHIRDGELDLQLLETTVTTAIRMLDNVVDINYYPTPEARNANIKHRPVGLGIMGFQDALHQMGIPYASDAAMEFADLSMEAISYFAILASSRLAELRGRYSSYEGSKWDRGILPLDSINILEESRGESTGIYKNSRMDWSVVRESIALHGMRNSKLLAIAPTATISTIVGASQSIEPTYKYLYAKSNLSGDFTQINDLLVEGLKKSGLWNSHLLDDLKYHDGSLAEINAILRTSRTVCLCLRNRPVLADRGGRAQTKVDRSGAIAKPLLGEAKWQVNRRDVSIGLAEGVEDNVLSTLFGTQVEKSTLDVNRHGIQPKWMKSKSESSAIQVNRIDSAALPKACSIQDPDCESCQ